MRVLVGDYTTGNCDLVRPPPKNSDDPYGEAYDTCVNDVNSPTVFVTFDFPPSYPEYLIQYYYT